MSEKEFDRGKCFTFFSSYRKQGERIKEILGPEKALEYLRTEAKFPIVLKADGLALGKGVLICQDLSEAEAGVKEIMEDKKFGNAGNTMVHDRP